MGRGRVSGAWTSFTVDPTASMGTLRAAEIQPDGGSPECPGPGLPVLSAGGIPRAAGPEALPAEGMDSARRWCSASARSPIPCSIRRIIA